MDQLQKALLFICSTGKCDEGKLSHKIAAELHHQGVADIGDISMFTTQRDSLRKRFLIFINDCQGSCIKMFTRHIPSHQYLYLDVTRHKENDYLNTEKLLSALKSIITEAHSAYQLSDKNHSA